MLNADRNTTTASLSIGDCVQIVRAEFLEIPGLQLTRPQVQRLWGLDDTQCTLVLTGLVETRFLKQKSDGRYIRVDHGLTASNRRARRLHHA
jgi:hypothetical protein